MKIRNCHMTDKLCINDRCAKFASCTYEEMVALYGFHLDAEAKQLEEEIKEIIRGKK